MSPLGLSGLASGLDTEAIITQLMGVERQPRTRMVLQDTQAQARQTQLKELATKLGTVRDAAAALRSTTTWADVQKVSSSDTAQIAVTAKGTVAPGSRLIEVSQVAVAAQHAFEYTPSTAVQSISIGSTFALTVDPSSTVATVAAAINARNDAPVTAVVAGGKLVLTNRASGEPPLVPDDVAVGTGLLTELPAYARAGANAEYTIDGSPRSSASNVITDAVLGLELTLKSTTAASAPVSVSVGDPGTDIDGVKAKVQAFVSAYNTTVDYIRAKVSEQPVKNPTTTTDAAKGLFRGDTMLNGVLTSMRSQIGDLSDLGISTGTPSGATRFSADAVAGHLEINDAKLTAAVAGDRAVLRTRLEGLSDRITAVVTPVAGAQVTARLSSEDAVRKRLADAMSATDVRLADKEKHLRAQFSAMESALGAAQAAQAQMSAQLGSLSSRG